MFINLPKTHCWNIMTDGCNMSCDNVIHNNIKKKLRKLFFFQRIYSFFSHHPNVCRFTVSHMWYKFYDKITNDLHKINKCIIYIFSFILCIIKQKIKSFIVIKWCRLYEHTCILFIFLNQIYYELLFHEWFMLYVCIVFEYWTMTTSKSLLIKSMFIWMQIKICGNDSDNVYLYLNTVFNVSKYCIFYRITEQNYLHQKSKFFVMNHKNFYVIAQNKLYKFFLYWKLCNP